MSTTLIYNIIIPITIKNMTKNMLIIIDSDIIK